MRMFDQIESMWTNACTRYKPGHMEIAGVITAQLAGIAIPATFYLLLDVLFPEFSKRHKVQNAGRQPTWAQIWHCVRVSMFNQIWVSFLHSIGIYIIGVEQSLLIMNPHIPSLNTLMADFLLGLVAREVLYYIHRALHHPSIYVCIHKMHHKYTDPISFAAEYAHPVEHILASIHPIILPLTLKGTHFLSLMAFTVFQLWEAAADYSGYDFLKLPPASIHDLHHEKFRVNYSTLGTMDWIHGTDVVGWDRPRREYNS